jgi:hypothetical protein
MREPSTFRYVKIVPEQVLDISLFIQSYCPSESDQELMVMLIILFHILL